MAKKKAVEVADGEETKEEVATSVPLESSAPRRVAVTLRGKPPGLLMSSKAGMDPNNSGKSAKQPTPEREAHLAAYWCANGDGKPQLALPWVNLYKSIVAGSKRFRFKGRETMEKLVAATIACEQDMIPLGTDIYKIDSRWGRIPPKTGGVVMLNRALMPEWEASFVLLVDDEFYPADKLQEVLVVTGKLVGVCANRPELKGPYGRWGVTRWEILE